MSVGQDAAIFRHRRSGATCLLVVSGTIGRSSAERLRRELHLLLFCGERRVIVDLREATFDGPSGPAVLILAVRVMRAQGGTITIVEAAEPAEPEHPDPVHVALRRLVEDQGSLA